MNYKLNSAKRISQVTMLVLLMLMGLGFVSQAAQCSEQLPLPGFTDQDSVSISLSQETYRPCDVIEGTVSVSLSRAESITVSISGPGVTPSSFSLDSGESKTISIELPCEDAPLSITYTASITSGDGSEESDSATVTLLTKMWDSGSAIGSSAGAQDGRMISPQDQRADVDSTEKIQVGFQGTLACEVEGATDSDHWKQGEEEGEAGDSVSSYLWSASGGTITPDPSDPKKATWTAPNEKGSFTIKCTIDDAPTAVESPDRGSRDDSALVRQVQVEVASYKVEVQAKRSGTDDSRFASSAKVAAASGSADIRVKVTNLTGGLPVSGVTFDAPQITGGDSGVEGYRAATVSFSSLTTDSNGELRGSLRASNAIENLSVEFTSPQTDSSSATVDQVWSELEGSDESWVYSKEFEYGVAEPITYRMQFTDEEIVPISGHSMTFETTGLSGEIWDETAGEDIDGDGQPDGGFEPEHYDNEEIDIFGYRDLVTYPPVVTETPAGSYHSSQTVSETKDDYFFVDSVEFDIVDQDVLDNGSGSE
jgi:hypothetical protein